MALSTRVWRSVRHGKVAWTQEQVEGLSRAILGNLPDRACQLIRGGDLSGGELVVLEDAIARPSYKDIAANFVWLRPVVEAYPERVPSGFFLTDVFLSLDEMFDGKLLQVQIEPGATQMAVRNAKVTFSAREANRLKKLVGSLRYLNRNSRRSHDHRVSELKALLKPSPNRQRQNQAEPESSGNE
ncbi:unnamed protein product, partial [Effrenium voratum]